MAISFINYILNEFSNVIKHHHIPEPARIFIMNSCPELIKIEWYDSDVVNYIADCDEDNFSVVLKIDNELNCNLKFTDYVNWGEYSLNFKFVDLIGITNEFSS